jgi:bacterioferritin-associated ferredoxin
MLVCHCNIITSREIEETIEQLLDADPWQLVVPAKVYRALEKRGRCCGCFPNVVDIIIRVTETYHREHGADPAQLVDIQERLAPLKQRFKGGFGEGRRAGHRAA